jgi:hypothetical protein
MEISNIDLYVYSTHGVDDPLQVLAQLSDLLSGFLFN